MNWSVHDKDRAFHFRQLILKENLSPISEQVKKIASQVKKVVLLNEKACTLIEEIDSTSNVYDFSVPSPQQQQILHTYIHTYFMYTYIHISYIKHILANSFIGFSLLSGAK